MKVEQRLKNNMRETVPDFLTKRKLGYKSFFGFENKFNPFFLPLMCASHDTSVGLSTSIAVAFARSPMEMALDSYSLNQLCEGRFKLGLGSQIKPHITRRFGMPWTDKPATQMREYIAALHAIWDAFESGERLNFEGETYRHTLLSPEFTPFIEGYGRPPVLLGAVGPGMTRAAAAVADGMITHSFVSELSLRELNDVALQKGLAERGKPRSEFELVYPVFIATGATEEEYKKKVEWHRHRIGFYASTPSYKVQLDLHGWGDLHYELNKMTKEGRWDELGQPISDEMVDTFCVRGEPDDIAPIIKKRYSGLVDTIQSNLELEDEETQYQIIKQIEDI